MVIMSEMVERVAMALARALHGSASDEPIDLGEVARAAIEAMREPTDEQRNRYFELSFRTEVFNDGAWERGIDAALPPQRGL